MYFIPRNNRFYNYIAHTSSIRCYLATLAIIGVFFVVGAYCVYYPLLNLVAVYNVESLMLQKKYAELAQLDKSIKEFGILIDSKKNIIQTHSTSFNVEQNYQEQLTFILEIIAQLGLSLDSYSFSKEKDKKWHIKNLANFEISGDRQSLMMFLESIKKCQKMITVPYVTLNHKADNLFHMNVEINLVKMKKV